MASPTIQSVIDRELHAVLRAEAKRRGVRIQHLHDECLRIGMRSKRIAVPAKSTSEKAA